MEETAWNIRSIYYRSDDLVGLSRVYAASSDAANLSDAAAERASTLEALRRERQAMEARNRRHGEIEKHVSAARQLGYARRLQELQVDAQAPGEQENVPPPPPPPGGKTSLEQARQQYASFVARRAPEWEGRRREAEKELIAQLRAELLDMQAQRAAAQADFAAGLQQRAVRLHEQQRLQGLRDAQAHDAAAHASLLAEMERAAAAITHVMMSPSEKARSAASTAS